MSSIAINAARQVDAPADEAPELGTVPADVTGVLLCGGGGRRLGGADKPLLAAGSGRLVDEILVRLRPAISDWVVSANRNLERYRALGHRVATDLHPDVGPLAGIAAAAQSPTRPWLYVIAGDAPAPDPILPRLLRSTCAGAPAAFAKGPDGPSPLPLLVRRDAIVKLPALLAGGLRRVGDWLALLGAELVEADLPAEAWVNINTPEDLDHWRRGERVDR